MTHRCKCHSLPYYPCQMCGHEFCPRYWTTACPRCHTPHSAYKPEFNVFEYHARRIAEGLRFLTCRS